uniref:Uncharacterized protein n=1 Tax=Arundo donax TaxID=35708 RepID=A0A0A9H015_ARUDO
MNEQIKEANFYLPLVLLFPTSYHHMSAARKLPDKETFSPGLNGGRPLYGQVPHRKASPNPQLPQAD